MNYIYALIDPITKQPRYVGKTDNLSRRLATHLKDRSHCHRAHWIQSLLSQGLKPTLLVIESIPSDQGWQERERFWISHYRNLGCTLTNNTDGGDCPPSTKGRKLNRTEAGRRNITAALVERNKSPEMREASRQRGLSRKGVPMPAGFAERVRQWMTGRKHHTKQFKRDLAKRNKTREYDSLKLSEIQHNLPQEIKNRISQAVTDSNRRRTGIKKSRPPTAKQRKHMSEAQLNLDPEKKARISQAVSESNRRRAKSRK